MFAVALASGSGRPGTPVPNDLSPGSRPGRPDAHGRGPTPPCSRRGPQTPRGGRASDVAPRTVRSGRNGHSSHRSRWLSGAPPDGGQPDSASQIVVPLVELRCQHDITEYCSNPVLKSRVKQPRTTTHRPSTLEDRRLPSGGEAGAARDLRAAGPYPPSSAPAATAHPKA